MEIGIVEISVILSVLAGVAQLFGYYLYNRAIYKGEIIPNPSSWGLWAVGSIIVTVFYGISSDDLVKSILPICCTIACVFTFIFLLIRRRFAKPDFYDVFIIIIDLAVVFFWIKTGLDEEANILIQADIILSHLPIIRGVIKKPRSERATPWLVWVVAYALMTTVVYLRFEKWSDFLYPIILMTLSLIIATLSLRRKGRKRAIRMARRKKV